MQICFNYDGKNRLCKDAFVFGPVKYCFRGMQSVALMIYLGSS